MKDSKQQTARQAEASSHSGNGQAGKYRTTVVLPPNIGEHLEIVSFKRRISKNEIIEKAVFKYLIEEEKLKPDQKPIVDLEAIEVTY